MRYSEFEKRITVMALAAPADAQHRFAMDTIQRLADSSADAIDTELSPAEHELITGLLAHLWDGPPAELMNTLNTLHESMGKDPVRGIEFRPDLVELIAALDTYIRYRETGRPSFIADIAIHGVNGVDYAIGGEDEGYSVKNMLASPRMRAEFERQRRLLESRSE